MITSWNVNGFFGDKHYKDYKPTDKMSDEDKKHLKEEADKKQANVFNSIKKTIQNFIENDSLLILHELPHKGYDIYDSFRDFFKDEFIDNLYPSQAFIETVAICQKNTYVRCFDDLIEMEFDSYKNRVICLCKKSEKSNPTEVIIGVHSPTQKSITFWNSLILTHQHIVNKYPECRIIYIGDMNVNLDKPDEVNTKKMAEEFMSEGLADLWLKSGKSQKEATFNANTCIDYALITEKDADKYEITADHDIRTKDKLSDHSAIILKERTPEMKKTGD
ncbi:hypothetical protein [uncultured Ruminococcus sp.]|uniref:hypothetical protein n=1 Tax=uncultured Ruminococcus sp. TaxID=165186 RepID=UPI000EF0309C|nr:hypothetical protein [uncultured Ruminococcus sp.]HCJ41474.1 hypothetical protein [Ruminococcus sp.]